MRGRRSADGDPQVAVHAGEPLRDAPDHHRSAGRRLTGLDPRERPVRFVRHPHGPLHDRDPRGAVPDPDRAHDRVRVGADPHDGVVQACSRPTRRPRSRPATPARCPHRSARHLVRLGVDPHHRVRPGQPHPYAAEPDRDPAGSSPTGIVSTTAPGSGRCARSSRRTGWSPRRSPRRTRCPPGRSRPGSGPNDLVRVGADPRDGRPAAVHDPHGVVPRRRSRSGSLPPGWSRRTSCSFASIRVTVPTSGLVTQTASAEAATDPGRPSRPIVPVTSPDSRVEDADRVGCDRGHAGATPSTQEGDARSEDQERDGSGEKLPRSTHQTTHPPPKSRRLTFDGPPTPRQVVLRPMADRRPR